MPNRDEHQATSMEVGSNLTYKSLFRFFSAQRCGTRDIRKLFLCVALTLLCPCATLATQGTESSTGPLATSAGHPPVDLLQRAETHLQQGQKQAALEIFAQLERDLPKSAKLELLIGTLLARHKSYSEAQSYFARALAMEPGLYDACYNSALAYLNMDQPAKAVDVLAQVRPQERNRGDFRNLLGNAYWKLEDVERAGAELQMAYHLDPENVDYYLDAGSFFLHFNTPRPAVDILRAGLQHAPDSPRLHFALGVALILIEMHKDAQKHLQEACLRAPQSPPSVFALAYSYFFSGQYEQAEASLRDYVRLSSNDYRAYYYLALSLKNQQEKNVVDEIALLLGRCLSLNPDFAPAHFELGVFYNRKQEFDKAITSLQRAILIDPEFLEAHVTLTNAYARVGNTDGARRESELVRELQQKVHAKRQANEDDPTRRTLDYFVQQVGPQR